MLGGDGIDILSLVLDHLGGERRATGTGALIC